MFKTTDKNLFYTGDIGSKKDLYLFSGEKINYMITEITHVSAEDILNAAKELIPEKLFLTHISDLDTQKISAIIIENTKIGIPTFEAIEGLKFYL